MKQRIFVSFTFTIFQVSNTDDDFYNFFICCGVSEIVIYIDLNF
jgi:hypothetical protein